MKTRSQPISLTIALLLSLAGCGREDTTARTPEMPRFDDPGLAAGRSAWMGACRSCHLLGVAGAPAVTDFMEWERRLVRGKEALYHSALVGVQGEDGTYRMPPHGGNPRLSEHEVRGAVDYMVAAAEHLHSLR